MPGDTIVRERIPPPKLRALCLSLEGTEERLSHGEPAWFVGGRLYLTLADHHHDDRVAFWAAAPEGAQEVLVASEPQTYFRPPFYGHRGWVGMWLDTPTVDWDAVAVRVREAHALIASR